MAKYNIVISGYYGFHNAGDEAMLLAILQALRKTFDAPSITVISGNPSDTARTFGVKAVPRFGILPILSSLFRTDLLISGGGSLLQDVTSWKSMIYYLTIIIVGVLSGTGLPLFAGDRSCALPHHPYYTEACIKPCGCHHGA